MIIIKGRVATYGEIWFDEEPPADPAVDILMYRLRPAPVEGKACTPFHSLVNDLAADAETIIAGMGNTNRYKIKRADSKDGLEALFIVEPAAHLEAFYAFYDTFAQQKALEASYRRGLTAAADAGQLVLTCATRGGEAIVWHAYVRFGATAALLHSASHFRGKDAGERAVVGRANRWLHWRDMLSFKSLGLQAYDWGGMFEDESVPEQASINIFKREFGGRPRCRYNCTFAVTTAGKLYLGVRELF